MQTLKKSKSLPCLLTALCGLFITTSPALAQSSAFTHQGQLTVGGSPANGIYDLRLTVHDLASTAWAVISDRHVKKDFARVDPLAILGKLAAMPITQSHYQWEAENSPRHAGPMAQDFQRRRLPRLR